jgi:dolichol kinase
MDLETRRQLIHMSGFVIALYIPWANTSWGFIYLALSLFIAVLLLYIVSLAYRRNRRVPGVAWLIDISERREVIEHSPAKGAIMFLLGTALAVILFDAFTAAAAVTVLALGDSVSTLVGRKYGSIELPYNAKKSLQGSLAGFVAAFLGASLIVPPLAALLAAFGGMLGESLPLKIDDNLVIPLFSGAGMASLYLI